MYTEEQFTQLEQEERELTDETILLLLLILANVKGNLKKELRNFYSKYGKDGVVTYSEARKWVNEQDHRRRLTALILYISGEFNGALSDIKTTFEAMLKSVINKETEFFGVEIDDWDNITEAKWGSDESNWLDRIDEDIALWVAYIASDLKRSILQRQSIEFVLSQVDKRFKIIESVVTTLGLSESTAIGSLTRRKIFGELGITKYQFYTKPDERRCETCGAMHGLVFPISAYEVGVTASPLHPRCRCWEVPIWD